MNAKQWIVGPDQKATVLKTEFGFEPAYAWKERGAWGEFSIEPGFAKATRAEAEADMEKDLARCRAIDGASRLYASQYACACGEHD